MGMLMGDWIVSWKLYMEHLTNELRHNKKTGINVLLQEKVYGIQEWTIDGYNAFSLTALIDRGHDRDCQGRRSVIIDTLREAERSRRDWSWAAYYGCHWGGGM